LQDHGNPVRYRNIWLRELRETDEAGPPSKDEPPVVALPKAALEKYVGEYRLRPEVSFSVALDDGRLYAKFYESELIELIPHSAVEFSMPWTAGKIEFELEEEGAVQGFKFYLGGNEYVTRRVR
jgi:hypothetical protein